MSKKGSDLQLPDYSPIIGMMTKASEYSYNLARSSSWAKKTYADNKAIGDGSAAS
jgi:hypothetical protein